MFVFPPPTPVDIGPCPWDEELLRRAVFINHAAVQKALDEHPGREIGDRLDSLSSCLRLFNKTAHAIQLAIERFHVEAHTNNLLRRNRSDDRQRLKEDIQEQLYVFAACAITLVDQSRALSQKLPIPGYAERVADSFSQSARHRFIQELRVDMIHVSLHEPHWQLISRKDEDRSTKFLLHSSQLRRVSEYHALAKQYVAMYPQGIDVGETVSLYQEDVQAFQSWFQEAVETVAKDHLHDFRRCGRIVRAASSRSWWHIILSQVLIQAKRDPYAYVDQCLTSNELREISKLPHRTKVQVDRIIELIDGDGACDQELRKLTYQAFGLSGP